MSERTKFVDRTYECRSLPTRTLRWISFHSSIVDKTLFCSLIRHSNKRHSSRTGSSVLYFNCLSAQREALDVTNNVPTENDQYSQMAVLGNVRTLSMHPLLRKSKLIDCNNLGTGLKPTEPHYTKNKQCQSVRARNRPQEPTQHC